MGTPHLATADYWESEEVDLRFNPRMSFRTAGLCDFVRNEVGVRRAVVLATSGSSGVPKFVLLSKTSLLFSAESVIAHLGLSGEDRWLAGLPDFHVGGLGMYARAYRSGAEVVSFPASPWQRDGRPFAAALLESGARWTSLTPTHLYDLVTHGVKAPPSLRGALLGGGRIEASLVAKAVTLGWPVRASYGMTEASSQIATVIESGADPAWLPLLSGWETKTGGDGRLMIRGGALFSGYVLAGEKGWRFEAAQDADGWFTTGDRCEVRDGCLRYLGRADDLVKVSGEFVAISAVEARIAEIASQFGFASALVALPESRRGQELVAVIEAEPERAAACVAILEASLKGLEKLSRVVPVSEIPRTAVGKVDRERLRAVFCQS